MMGSKGLSDTITVMIILIASVIAAVSVVVIAFALLSSNSKLEEVYAVGSGKIQNGYLYVTISSNTYVNIISLSVNLGDTVKTVQENVPLQPGLNNVTLVLPSDFTPVNYTVYSFTLTLSNGKTVIVSGTVG